MKINALEIDGFGICSALRIEGFADGLSVLYGPNEAGKTTLLQFIRSMLYGFSPDRRRYLPPVYGNLAGGMIDVSSPIGRFEIARHLQSPHAEAEQLLLIAPDGTRQGEHLIKTLLSNIDETIFNNVFAVELRELQELATLSDTDAAALLYNLSAGMDRVSLVQVVRELDDSRNLILDAEGKPSQLTHLWQRRETLLSSIDELSSLSRQYSRLAEELNRIERELQRREEDKNQAQRQLCITELALKVRDSWQRRSDISEQLAALGAVLPVPSGAIKRLDKLNARLKKHQRLLDVLRMRLGALKAEAAALKQDERLSRQAARIEALCEQESWLVELKAGIEELDAEIATLQAEFESKCALLGFESCELETLQPFFAPKAISKLRSPARTLRSCREKLKQARQDQEKAAEQTETLSHRIQAGLAVRQATDLASAIEQAGLLAADYRRRLQIDERLDQLARHQRDLEEQSESLIERQLLPVGVIAGLGCAFILGVVLIMAGLFVSESIIGSAGWAMALLGLAGGGSAVAAKYFLEKTQASRLDRCQKHLALVRSQIQQAQSDRDQLDARLPRGGGPLVSRLQAAECELAALEELSPLESKRAAAEQQATFAAERVAQAKKAYASARARWRETLDALRLPEKFTPRRLRALSEQWQHLVETQRELNARRDEIQRRKQEWEWIGSRVARTAADAGVIFESQDLCEQIKQLRTVFEQQQDALSKRDAMRRHIRHLRLKRAKHGEAVSRLKHLRRELFFETGARDEPEFRRRVLHHARAELLRNDYDSLKLEIDAAINGQCSEEALGKQLQDHPAKELQTRLTALRARLEGIDTQILVQREKRGELKARMQALTEDRQLSEKQLELAVVEKSIDEASQRWRILAATCSAMDRIRKTYEQERQPETLREASTYLQRLTRERYRRVWTPLGQNVLRVEDGEGRSLPVEVLSRGTREQLFLSLRMALAASYARRGAALPLVLDDVLVNFDTERAAEAAAVLCDFARDARQIVVFTCHEHIANIFASLNAPVSSIPYDMRGNEALITFETSAEKPEKEVKKIRGRTSSRRKTATKTNEAQEEIVFPSGHGKNSRLDDPAGADDAEAA
ncbi:MAG: ATP-binding protein [Thermoguttaceae bacterium]